MSVFNPIIIENSNMDNNQSNKDESEVEIISKKRKIDFISPTESNMYNQNFFSENPYYAICNIKVFEKIHTRKCVTLFIAQYSHPKLSIKDIKSLDLIVKYNIYNLLVLTNPKVEYILLKNSDIFKKVRSLIPNGVITEYSSSDFELFNDYLKLSLNLPDLEFMYDLPVLPVLNLPILPVLPVLNLTSIKNNILEINKSHRNYTSLISTFNKSMLEYTKDIKIVKKVLNLNFIYLVQSRLIIDFQE